MSLISSDAKRLTIREITRAYHKNSSTIRFLLKKELARVISHDEKHKLFQKGIGPYGDTYHLDLIERVLGARPDQNFNAAQQYIHNNHEDSPTIPLVLSQPDKGKSSVLAILGSRQKSQLTYDALIQEMVRNGSELRIRCVTGTDFFNSHRPIIEDFYERSQKNSESTKVLLVHPNERGGRIRSAAEGEMDHKSSQFKRDADSTIGFMTANARKLKLNPKWVEELPNSLLIWTQEFAMLEPYDHGHDGFNFSGCIGRKAPMLVVNGDSAYHDLLKNGFDYVFDKSEKETFIRTWSLQEMRAITKGKK